MTVSGPTATATTNATGGLVPTITVQTSDEHPGAELIDVVASSLLGSGFGLLARLEPVELAALPLLADWYAELDPAGRVLQIVEPTGTLYDGDLGPRPAGTTPCGIAAG